MRAHMEILCCPSTAVGKSESSHVGRDSGKMHLRPDRTSFTSAGVGRKSRSPRHDNVITGPSQVSYNEQQCDNNL